MSAFIILAVLILLFTAFFFIGKISETSMSIRKANATEDGDDSYDDMEYVSNINGYLSLAFMVGFLFLSFCKAFLGFHVELPLSSKDRLGKGWDP